MMATINGPDQAKAVQLLRGLGLTGTEAEVYFTALQTCSGEPVSSYKLAQIMGRDPANVAKTLGALVHVQAVTVVQDKPRLFLPTDPNEFTDGVLARMQSHGRQAVELLQRLQAPQPDVVTLALPGPDQALTKARELLAGCRESIVVFGSKESLREIGAELEELGRNPEIRVRVLSPLNMVSENVEIAVFSPISDLNQLLAREFLQLVVDDRAWLSVVLDDKADLSGCGWWSNHSPIAGVLAGAMTLAWHAGHSPQPAVVPPPEPTTEPAIQAPAAPAPAPEASVADTGATEGGITFLMRHEDRQTKKKGEQ